MNRIADVIERDLYGPAQGQEYGLNVLAITWRTPGADVGRVEVIPAYHPRLSLAPGDTPGMVTLMLIPSHDPNYPDAPRPGQNFLDAVCAYLDPRRLVTTELYLTGPSYVPIWVSIGIQVLPGISIAETRNQVRAAIQQFLSPLPPNRGHMPTDNTVDGFASGPKGWPLGKPVVGVHHLEGHLLSPLLAEPAPPFPFVALLVSGGHTQLLSVRGWGQYELLGDTLDDAAGEAFDKTAQLLGLGYPGGPAVSRAAEFGTPDAVKLPRPMLHSNDLDFSFSGLKTAVLTAVRREGGSNVCEQAKADIARGFVDAIVDVLASKSMHALDRTGLATLVVAGGVGANRQLRERLQTDAATRRTAVFFPPLPLCTDNGAMIALAGAAKLRRTDPIAFGRALSFSVHPRWTLAEATA